MKKNNKVILKNIFYNLDFNIYCLFKKKIFRKKGMMYFIKYMKLFKLFKSFILLNVYQYNDYLDVYINKYNILKICWFYFLLLYKLIYIKKVRLLVNKFFKYYLIKVLIKNLFFNYKNKMFSILFKKLKLNRILKSTHINIRINVTKIFKKKINKSLKINLSFFFFNNYKKKLLAMIIKYLYVYYNFKIKKEFIFFWTRFYTYSLKRIYTAANYIFKYYIKYIYLQYKLFLLLISFKKKKIKKNIFFFIFFFNKEHNWFLKKFIINKIYGQIFRFKFKDFNIYKKNYFSLFLFNLKVKKINNGKLLKLKKKHFLLKFFIKMRFFFNFNNLIFLFFFKFLIIWLNFFLIVKKNYLIGNYYLNYFFYKVSNKYLFKKLFVFIENKFRGKRLFNNNYYFFNNIIK